MPYLLQLALAACLCSTEPGPTGVDGLRLSSHMVQPQTNFWEPELMSENMAEEFFANAPVDVQANGGDGLFNWLETQERILEKEFEVEVLMDVLEITIDHHANSENVDVKDSGAIAVRLA